MKPFILLDGLRGIYVPQKFAQLEGIGGISAEDLAILRAGPDHESYWEAWEEALRFGEITVAGICYSLHQNEEGDLFAVPPGWEVNADGSLREPEGETLCRYVLPASWACYLANGDESEDGEGEEVEAFLRSEGLTLWTFSDCGESFFGKPDCGGLRGDVAEFTFVLIK
jgi:hypothetical protein